MGAEGHRQGDCLTTGSSLVACGLFRGLSSRELSSSVSSLVACSMLRVRGKLKQSSRFRGKLPVQGAATAANHEDAVGVLVEPKITDR